MYFQRIAMFRLTTLLRAGGGNKPSWSVPKHQLWNPQMPDKQHYGEHATFNGFVLWVRGIRPYLEKMLGDTFNTSKAIAMTLYKPLSNFVVKHNPDLRHQLVALTAFGVTTTTITGYLGSLYQNLVDTTSMIELGKVKDLENAGFWRSESEEADARKQQYFENHQRLQQLWNTALHEATVSRSFQTLVQHLKVDDNDIPDSVPTPLSWRFNMIPYGQGNADTQTFPIPDHEQPLRSFALNFTYTNLSGDWGDYISRKDNKMKMMRPARQMFTDVYIPPTK